MGERAEHLQLFDVLCICVFCEALGFCFFFLLTSLETNSAILHNYTKMLYVLFFLSFFSALKKSALYHHWLYYTYKMW